jgi:hypothetical protein
MSLTDDLAAASAALPVRLSPQKDGSLIGEAVLAERRAFISGKKLTYRCKARVDEASRTVRFWEMLVEMRWGAAGGPDGAGSGASLSAGVPATGGKERPRSIAEVARCFGKDYSYRWDYSAVRASLQRIAVAAGYGWATVPGPTSV